MAEKNDKYIDAKELEDAFSSDNYLEGLSPKDLDFKDDSDKIRISDTNGNYTNESNSFEKSDNVDIWNSQELNKIDTLKINKDVHNPHFEESRKVLESMQKENEKFLNKRPLPDGLDIPDDDIHNDHGPDYPG